MSLMGKKLYFHFLFSRINECWPPGGSPSPARGLDAEKRSCCFLASFVTQFTSIFLFVCFFVFFFFCFASESGPRSLQLISLLFLLFRLAVRSTLPLPDGYATHLCPGEGGTAVVVHLDAAAGPTLRRFSLDTGEQLSRTGLDTEPCGVTSVRLSGKPYIILSCRSVQSPPLKGRITSSVVRWLPGKNTLRLIHKIKPVSIL